MESLLVRPENAGALLYLAHGRPADESGFGPPSPQLDRGHLGSNPAVVDRLWEVLNAALPADARWLVFDSAALVHQATGVILAAAIGTQYALRLLPEHRAAAVAGGSELVHAFRTVGTTLDLPATFGPDWVFGTRDEREGEWVRASYEACGT
ncbi:MAG: hypothetical protein ACXWWU_00920 [Candidatus Limnocylindria bacterium]